MGLHRFDKLLSNLSFGLTVVGGTCLLLMMLHVTVDVLMKYLFSYPIIGTLEIVSYYYMVAAVFLPLAAVERKHAHIFVEVFTQSLPARPQSLINGVAVLLGAAYVAVLTWQTGVEAVRQTAVLEAWDATFFDIPVWPTRWFLPIGCGALTLFMLLHGVRDLVQGITVQSDPSVEPRPGYRHRIPDK